MDYKNLYIILYAFCFLVLLFFRNLVNKKRAFHPAFDGVFFGCLLYYTIIPILSIINVDRLYSYEYFNSFYRFYNHTTINRLIRNIDYSNHLFAIFLVLIFITFFCVAYLKKRKPKELNESIDLGVVRFFMNATFYIGFISLLLLFYSLGGLENALNYGEFFRSFSNNLSDTIGWKSIFFLTSRLITVTPYLCYFMINNNLFKTYRKYKKLHITILFILSFCFSFLYFFFNAGRTPLIIFVLCFVYLFIKKKIKIKNLWKVLILCAIIMLPLLDVLDAFFAGKPFSTISINYVKYLYEFITPFRNIINVREITSISGFHYGKDFLTAILDLLPGITMVPSYEGTSLYINGSLWHILGGIPNDFITFSYLQFGVFGVMLFSSLMGHLTQLLDQKCSYISDESSRVLFGAVLTTNLFPIIGSSDFVSLIRGAFVLIITIIIIVRIGVVKK